MKLLTLPLSASAQANSICVGDNNRLKELPEEESNSSKNPLLINNGPTPFQIISHELISLQFSSFTFYHICT